MTKFKITLYFLCVAAGVGFEPTTWPARACSFQNCCFIQLNYPAAEQHRVVEQYVSDAADLGSSKDPKSAACVLAVASTATYYIFHV